MVKFAVAAAGRDSRRHFGRGILGRDERAGMEVGEAEIAVDKLGLQDRVQHWV